MKRKNTILILIILFISNSIFTQSEYRKSKNKKQDKNKKVITIKIPLKLKWGMSPRQVAKTIGISKLNFSNSKWAKYVKDEFRYWFYFSGGKKKLKQISIYFKNNEAFSAFMNEFKRKYSELIVKANLYKDPKTKVGIEATIKPQVIFLNY